MGGNQTRGGGGGGRPDRHRNARPPRGHANGARKRRRKRHPERSPAGDRRARTRGFGARLASSSTARASLPDRVGRFAPWKLLEIPHGLGAVSPIGVEESP